MVNTGKSQGLRSRALPVPVRSLQNPGEPT